MEINSMKKKPKYSIEQFAKQGAPKNQVDCVAQNVYCLCKNRKIDEWVICNACEEKFHICFIRMSEQSEFAKNNFECLRCLAKKLDPLYIVKNSLFQCCLKTEDVFKVENVFKLQFTVTVEDINSTLIEIRGLRPGKKSLSWPMQGQFYLDNLQNGLLVDLKPLLSNSNRKNRKEQYLTIPKQSLKIGKNKLYFRIPCLINQFKNKYQFDQSSTHFFGIYAIKKLTSQQLINKTMNNSRMEKKQSLQFLKSKIDPDIQIQKQKINLMCPYTRDRIKIPVRGKNCNHGSCICLSTLIAHHSKLRSWNCPICDERINEPVVDIWFLQMVNDNQQGYQAILSLQDGKYQWVSKINNMQELSDDDDSIEQPKQNIPEKPVNLPAQPIELLQSMAIRQANRQNQLDLIQSKPKPMQILQINDDSDQPILPLIPNKPTQNQLMDIQRSTNEKTAQQSDREKLKKALIEDKILQKLKEQKDIVKKQKLPLPINNPSKSQASKIKQPKLSKPNSNIQKVDNSKITQEKRTEQIYQQIEILPILPKSQNKKIVSQNKLISQKKNNNKPQPPIQKNNNLEMFNNILARQNYRFKKPQNIPKPVEAQFQHFSDVTVIHFQEINFNEYKSRYYKQPTKPKIPEQIRKLFKQIL